MKLWRMSPGLFAKFARSRSRVVLDTNVLISGTIARHGYPARIVTAARERRLSVVASPYLIGEYLSVIRRPHIARKYPKLGERLDLVRRFVPANAIFVTPQVIERVISDDPKDDSVIAAALEGKAKYIISGDEHLLALGEYRGIIILSPHDFVVNVLRESTTESRPS